MNNKRPGDPSLYHRNVKHRRCVAQSEIDRLHQVISRLENEYTVIKNENIRLKRQIHTSTLYHENVRLENTIQALRADMRRLVDQNKLLMRKINGWGGGDYH